MTQRNQLHLPPNKTQSDQLILPLASAAQVKQEAFTKPRQGRECKPCERKTRKEGLRIPNDKHQRRQDELGKRRKLGGKGRGGLARRQEAPRQNKVKRKKKKDLFSLEEERQIERAQKEEEEEKEKGGRERSGAKANEKGGKLNERRKS